MIVLSLILALSSLTSVQADGLRSLGSRPSGKSKPKPSPSPYSLPADDYDPTARATKLSQRTRFFQSRKYSEPDQYLNHTDIINQARRANFSPSYLDPNFQFQTPTGILGSSLVGRETLFVALDQVRVSTTTMEEDAPRVVETILAQGGFPSLGSFSTVYNSLPEERRPTSAPFYDSDVAFAARFLTASPLHLRKVRAVSDIPFDKSTIVGLNDIIAPNTFEGLITSGKMFLVDLSRYGLEESDHAPNSVIEAPIGLFFVASTNRLMPLAIKFTIQNTLTYSPKDSHADWFLAKAFFNLMDTTTNALVHFIDTHFVLSHICQSVTQSLAPEHPLTPLFTASCSNNDGVIQNGIPALLSDGAAFDGLLAVSGRAIRYKLLTAAGGLYDWSKKGLDADLTARGVKTGVPNFDYATDATALLKIISTYVSSYLTSYYRTDARVGGDSELSTMIRKLSASDSPIRINGFPSSVTSISSLAEIVTRVIYLAGVQHHALNSYNVLNYYHVYPQNPGKIPFVPPAKGILTDALLKDSILMFGLPVTSFLPFFLSTVSLGYIFAPVLQANQRLDNSFCNPSADGKIDAFVQMRNSLNDLSNTIQARASRDAAAGLVPPYTALDPDNLPVGTTI